MAVAHPEPPIERAGPAGAAEPAAGKRARRVASTRARLIDVALDLYARQGFGPTTVDQIAEAAGIGRSSFFRYFSGKEAILFEPSIALYSWFMDQLQARPTDESPLTSVTTIFLYGDWPVLDRHDMARSRKVFKAEPSLQNSAPIQVAPTSQQLSACLQERSPQLDPLVVQAVADLAVDWAYAAFTAHIRDGQPLTAHFANVIGATCALTDELAGLSAGLSASQSP